MNLRMDVEVARGYKSASQIARVITENWAKINLYCPACANNGLAQAPNNTKAFDFNCSNCEALFQLKSSIRWDDRRIPDAGYQAMMHAILTGSNPNLLIMQYDPCWTVLKLVLVPSFFLSRSAIERRKPLSPTARRAGWIGCNILISNVPSLGKIAIVADGVAADAGVVRTLYAKAKPFSLLKTQLRGWALDVFRIIEKLPEIFSLRDVYGFEGELADLYPSNANIRPKIRQQLQVLRDLGMIRFLGQGQYSRSSGEIITNSSR